MKTHSISKLASLILLATSCLAPTDAWARLPKPIQATAVVLAVDVDSRTLVVKFAKAEKPVLLDWDAETEFLQDAQQVSVNGLKVGATVTLIYKNVSFRNPLLKRVSIPEHAKST
ncbi:MAG: hypothetical protein KJ070_14065 [Verrucomicrobia bacterium]|nr:hypothetical protein [Verrucomicrobiota bacterium]